MALKIRMSRRGTTNRPFYHIVATDSRSPRDGAYLEKLGTYNPLANHENEQRLTLVEDRIKHWLSVGAQPSDRVAKMIAQAGIIEAPKVTDKPIKSKPKKRSQERADAKAEKAAALKAEQEKPAEAPVAEEAPAADEAAA